MTKKENKSSALKTEWDLSPLMKEGSDAEIERELKEIENECKKFTDKWKSRDDYLKEPSVLKEALDEYGALERDFLGGGRAGYFFRLMYFKKQDSPEIKAKLNKVEDFAKKTANNLRFFTLNVAKISEKEQKKFLEFEGLRAYKHILEKAFANAKHLLSDDEEKIITLKSGAAFSNWVRMVSGLIAKEEGEIVLEDGTKKKANFSELVDGYARDSSWKMRERAGEAAGKVLAKWADIAEAEINSIISDKKLEDELRKYARADEERQLADDVDGEIVDLLLKVIAARVSIAKRFYALKAKLLGGKMTYYDRNAPYRALEKKYTYEDAVEIARKVFGNLDGEFLEIFNRFVSKGQIDVYPKKGKRSGAWCTSGLLTHPTYIALNFVSDIRDLIVLAHECGHGINDEMMRKKQNALNFDSPTSTAEVASTFMEDFVLKEMEKEADDEMKLAIMMMRLNEDVASVFRQSSFYRFERELHETIRQKGYLSKDEIAEIFKKHMTFYLGEDMDVSMAGDWWIYVSYFRTFFYAYSYSFGQLISKSLQGKVRKDRSFINKVKEFLSAGLSDSPKNLFAKMGIDITSEKFWNEGLDEVENLLNETEKLAHKLGKI